MTEAVRMSREGGKPAGLAEMLKPLLRARETGLIAIIVVLCVVMSFASPYFLTWVNIRAMTLVFAVEGIVVIGMTILLIAGGIDLSVGSVTALAMVIAGWLFLNGVDPWIASAISIAACTGLGATMGFFVTRVGLHHFIVSLAVMVIARGACLLGTGGRPLGLYTLPPEFKFIGQGAIGPIPVIIIVFVVSVVVFDFLVRRTTMFRKVFYTGSNERAAAYSGIRTKKVIFLTTTLCSALCGVAGIIYMARFGSAQPTFGIGMELNVIAAAGHWRRQSFGRYRHRFSGGSWGRFCFRWCPAPSPCSMSRSTGRTSSAVPSCSRRCPSTITSTSGALQPGGE